MGSILTPSVLIIYISGKVLNLVHLNDTTTSTLSCSLLFFSSLLILCDDPVPCFFHMCSFYILELGQPKAWDHVSPFWKPQIAYLFMPSVTTLSVNMWLVLYVFVPRLLLQFLQHHLWFRLVLIHLLTSSLSFLQACYYNIHP